MKKINEMMKLMLIVDKTITIGDFAKLVNRKDKIQIDVRG